MVQPLCWAESRQLTWLYSKYQGMMQRLGAWRGSNNVRVSCNDGQPRKVLYLPCACSFTGTAGSRSPKALLSYGRSVSPQPPRPRQLLFLKIRNTTYGKYTAFTLFSVSSRRNQSSGLHTSIIIQDMCQRAAHSSCTLILRCVAVFLSQLLSICGQEE